MFGDGPTALDNNNLQERTGKEMFNIPFFDPQALLDHLMQVFSDPELCDYNLH